MDARRQRTRHTRAAPATAAARTASPPGPRTHRALLARTPEWLPGGRFLLLEHTAAPPACRARSSWKSSTTTAAHWSWTVASGFGPNSAWYRNLRHTPRAAITTRGRRHHVDAEFLTPEDGARLMARYGRSPPPGRAGH
ncbi:nitroreductase/quinone reductase family protein [Yinghuangia aomiensis]